MADAPTRDELLAKAWARWREADFTWDGLAKKPWRGWVVNGSGYLVEADTGRRYSSGEICHSPVPSGRRHRKRS